MPMLVKYIMRIALHIACAKITCNDAEVWKNKLIIVTHNIIFSVSSPNTHFHHHEA